MIPDIGKYLRGEEMTPPSDQLSPEDRERNAVEHYLWLRLRPNPTPVNEAIRKAWASWFGAWS